MQFSTQKFKEKVAWLSKVELDDGIFPVGSVWDPRDKVEVSTARWPHWAAWSAIDSLKISK